VDVCHRAGADPFSKGFTTMSSTSAATGRLLTKAPSSKGARRAQASTVDADFAAEWNGLDKDRRQQIRRLVRIGRPQETPADAELAVGFATYQRGRAWYRFFLLWIVPLAIAGLIAGANLHPIVIGIVFGAVVSAVMVRRNFKRVERVNAELLAS